jgi:hypothetical protein
MKTFKQFIEQTQKPSLVQAFYSLGKDPGVPDNRQPRFNPGFKTIDKGSYKERMNMPLKKIREAVGDPISPNSVFKLSDPVHQKNLKSAATPAGPSPMKPTAPKPKHQSNTDRFVKRMVGSTMLSPL